MWRLRTNTSEVNSDGKSAAERRALTELKKLCQEHSVTWPKSELVAARQEEDGNDETNLLYVYVRRICGFWVVARSLKLTIDKAILTSA